MQERCFFCVSWFKAWNLEILGGRTEKFKLVVKESTFYEVNSE